MTSASRPMPKRNATGAQVTAQVIEAAVEVKSRSGRVVKPKVWQDGTFVLFSGEDEAFAGASSPHDNNGKPSPGPTRAKPRHTTASSDDDEDFSRGRATARSVRKHSAPPRVRTTHPAQGHGTTTSGGGGVFKQAAIEVLRVEGRFMSTGDIARLALKRGLVRCTGKTPEATMASALYTDIKRKESTSAFIRPAEGLFGLREWIQESGQLSVPLLACPDRHVWKDITRPTLGSQHLPEMSIEPIVVGADVNGKTHAGNDTDGHIPSTMGPTNHPEYSCQLPPASPGAPSSNRLMELLCAAEKISEDESCHNGGHHEETDGRDGEERPVAAAAEEEEVMATTVEKQTVSDGVVVVDSQKKEQRQEMQTQLTTTPVDVTAEKRGSSPDAPETATFAASLKKRKAFTHRHDGDDLRGLHQEGNDSDQGALDMIHEPINASSEAVSPLPTPSGNNAMTSGRCLEAALQAAEAMALDSQNRKGPEDPDTGRQWLSVARLCLAHSGMPPALRHTAEAALDRATTALVACQAVCDAVHTVSAHIGQPEHVACAAQENDDECRGEKCQQQHLDATQATATPDFPMLSPERKKRKAVATAFAAMATTATDREDASSRTLSRQPRAKRPALAPTAAVHVDTFEHPPLPQDGMWALASCAMAVGDGDIEVFADGGDGHRHHRLRLGNGGGPGSGQTVSSPRSPLGPLPSGFMNACRDAMRQNTDKSV